MIRYVLDTDHVSLQERGHASLRAFLEAVSPDQIGVTVISAEETLRGRLAVLSRARDSASRLHAYRKFREALDFYRRIPLLDYDDSAERQFLALRAARIRIGTQDLKIAAICLSRTVTLVTRNQVDFARVPGLHLEDWSGS